MVLEKVIQYKNANGVDIQIYTYDYAHSYTPMLCMHRDDKDTFR